MYSYKAEVLRVIDGDTIEVMVDLGFKTFRRELVRFARINVQEKDTIKGQEAYLYVIELLHRVHFIELQTFKQEKYGRYLAEIYYFNGQERINLNNELLEKGYAEDYKHIGD